MSGPRQVRLPLALTAAVVFVVAALLLTRSTAGPDPGDCRIVGELSRQWASTTRQGKSWLEQRFDGDVEMLTMTAAQDATAAAIREMVPNVRSPGIAADLVLWASGIEKMARSQRNEVQNPAGEDVVPMQFVQGSLELQHAGASLAKACPSIMNSAELAALGELAVNRASPHYVWGHDT